MKVQVKITMLYYIKEMLDCFENAELKTSDTKSNAAPLNLFVVDEDCEKTENKKHITYTRLQKICCLLHK